MTEGDIFILDRDFNALLAQDIEQYPGGIVIPLDKPYGWTSADAVRKIKFLSQRYFRKKNIKVGHAGTLDPLATGILLICIGKATKRAEWLQNRPKEYIAKIRFGATTPSYDLEKEIDATYPYEHITKEKIEALLPQMVGQQMQIPPLFSAKFIDGVRAYQKARAGENIELKAAEITIYDMQILDFTLPDLTLKISCSKGTYIRSIARDVGQLLGSGAHLVALTRTASGDFNIEKALSMENVAEFLKISRE